MTNTQTNSARQNCFKIMDTVPSQGSLRTENPTNWDHKKVRSIHHRDSRFQSNSARVLAPVRTPQRLHNWNK
jgi:hypothetical protein